jgi:F0F1-type ATP synthase assembly protein I
MPSDPRLRERSGLSSEAGDMMGVGLQFAASILLFLFLGMWLDEKLGTAPWLLIAGVFIGGTAGFYSIYRRLVVMPREKKKEEEAKK